MSHIIERRRIAAALALILCLSVIGLRIGAAKASPAGTYATRSAVHKVAPPHHRHRHKRKHVICPIDWRAGPGAVSRLIRCAAIHFHVPGGPQLALSIAWRESRFRPNAYNVSGAEGIYQHMRQYWPKRAAIYGFPHASPFNARANIMVTMQMVRAAGWAPWGD